MYKIKQKKDSHTSIKDIGGVQIYQLRSMKESLILTKDEFEEVGRSLNALRCIDVLTIIDLSKEKDVEEEVDPTNEAILFTDIARQLLSGEGLNHTSFTRGCGLDSKKAKDKKSVRKQYEIVLETFKSMIMRQGHDYFWKKN